MTTRYHETETRTEIDENGTITTSTLEKETKVTRNSEPDYIKLYTRMWFEFNQIPIAYHGLFIELATRMTYSDASNVKKSQLVYTGKPFSDEIMAKLKWKGDMYKKGLRELVVAKAIKRVARGVYQVNPSYAGKGEWKYNPRLDRGGVEDLVATFKFKDKAVETDIVWADDGTGGSVNEGYRKGLGVLKDKGAVLKRMVAKPIEGGPEAAGQQKKEYGAEYGGTPPLTLEGCRTHEDCLAYVWAKYSNGTPKLARDYAEELGFPILAEEEALELWERLAV